MDTLNNIHKSNNNNDTSFNIEDQISYMLDIVLKDEDDLTPQNKSQNLKTENTKNIIKESKQSFQQKDNSKLFYNEINSKNYFSDNTNYNNLYQQTSNNSNLNNMSKLSKDTHKLINPQMYFLTPQITGTKNFQNIPIQKHTISPNPCSLRSINPINNLIYNIHDNLNQK